jgi:hypothetical protein
MIALDFTTTAMRRPEILRKTYESFSTNLKGIDFSESTLYINIEPLPEEIPASEVVKVAESFFGHVIVCESKKCNFTAAVKWCWKNTTRNYVFHLEDDWILLSRLKVGQLIKRLNPPIVQVALKAYTYKYNKIALSPSLLSGQFVRDISCKLIITSNPEVQLRGENVRGHSMMSFPDRIIIKDIGRAWMKKSDYVRCSKVKHEFVAWKKQ